MHLRYPPTWFAGLALVSALWGLGTSADAQLTDVTQTPNRAHAGVQKSLEEQIGAGRGDVMTPDSSLFLIRRDPFRAVRRGRQVFQRKFTVAQGSGPRVDDGIGDIETTPALGAGLADSCAGCHGRPRGAAGSGGSVFTRPESRDAPHLFGVGLKEMLADEITAELRAIRAQALDLALGRGSRSPARSPAKGSTTARSLRCPMDAWTPPGSKASTPISACAPSWPTAGRSRCANSSSGRSMGRWGSRPRILS
jgi:hypothetical protein